MYVVQRMVHECFQSGSTSCVPPPSHPNFSYLPGNLLKNRLRTEVAIWLPSRSARDAVDDYKIQRLFEEYETGTSLC
jgi:hypothetical protein